MSFVTTIIFLVVVPISPIYQTSPVSHKKTIQAFKKIETVSLEDFRCLQLNVYFEARNQSFEGRKAVAWVTLNRMENKKYPDNICDVVYQARKDSEGNIKLYKCQFSWFCDGKSDTIKNTRAWISVGKAVEKSVEDWAFKKNKLVGEAIMYHSDYVSPYWAEYYTKVTQIESHIFYE